MDNPSSEVATKELKRDNIYWVGPYMVKNDKELQAYKYCVVEGFCWTVSKEGEVFCAGTVEKIKQRLAGDGTDAPETNPPLVTNPVTILSEGETTTLKDPESKEHNTVTPQNPPKTAGQPRKDLPLDVILQYSSEGLRTRQIAVRLSEELNTKISHMTIARILAGQKSLL